MFRTALAAAALALLAPAAASAVTFYVVTPGIAQAQPTVNSEQLYRFNACMRIEAFRMVDGWLLVELEGGDAWYPGIWVSTETGHCPNGTH